MTEHTTWLPSADGIRSAQCVAEFVPSRDFHTENRIFNHLP